METLYGLIFEKCGEGISSYDSDAYFD